MEHEPEEKNEFRPPQDEVDEDNNGHKDQDEKPKVCGTCHFFGMIGINPNNRVGFGACHNQEDELAPFGLIMASFGGCQGWRERVVPKIVKATAGMDKKLQNLHRPVKGRGGRIIP